MINYNVYSEDKNTVILDKAFTYLEGSFPKEPNAKLFMNAISKARPYFRYFIKKWDTEKNCFVE